MHNRKLLNIELGRVSAAEYKELPESGIVLVLDNIRSAHNVGSAFRTADSFKIDKVWLCGICAVPPSAEIHKSALGAEDSVAWEHVDDTMEAVRRLKEDGYTIVSAEQKWNLLCWIHSFRSQDAGMPLCSEMRWPESVRTWWMRQTSALRYHSSVQNIP